jgi:hypothetical protein
MRELNPPYIFEKDASYPINESAMSGQVCNPFPIVLS